MCATGSVLPVDCLAEAVDLIFRRDRLRIPLPRPSQWERENHRLSVGETCALEMVESRPLLPPLPPGGLG